ncbi:hypothetical protein COU94_01430, partial [Candidatus Shapirobacteria bacterium CG10_big_fil_rev_8_21_14_0_10_38_8]
VSLTIGLSVISSSVTDISLSGKSDDSARAFSAAEAGIEEGLVTGNSTGVLPIGETGATYQTATVNLGAGQTAFAFPGEYRIDQIQTFWLASYNSTNGTYTKVYDRTKLRVVWGNPNGTDNPALEATIYYKDGSDYKVGRFALDPNPAATDYFCQPNSTNCPATVSNFSTGGETVDGKDFKYGATLDLSGFRNGGTKYLLFARLRVLYSASAQVLGAVAVSGTGTSNFPSQGIKISAVGQSGSATRKVEVKRLLPAPPSFLDYTVYSEGGLVHQ